MKVVFDEIDVPTSGVAAAADPHALQTNRPVSENLHPQALWLVAGTYAGMIAIFWAAFVSTRDGAIAMGIVTLCLVACVATPAAMYRLQRRFWAGQQVAQPVSPSFREFLSGYVKVDQTAMPAAGAVTLIISLPIILALTATGMGIVFVATT